MEHQHNHDHQSSDHVLVGINGFGRIGRLLARVLFQKKTSVNLLLTAINDPKLNAAGMAYLLHYDSVHGKCCCDVEVEGPNLKINGQLIHVFSEMDASRIPWGDLGIEVVAETSGAYTSKEKAEAHLQAGAKQVVISAPAKNVPHFVLGVNHEKYDASSMPIISNASCTTNCLAPLAKLVNDLYGIEEGLMTTVHAVTATQAVVDGPSKKDFRAGRCATRNIIPASTGATEALTRVLPELEGKLHGMAFRVPVENVSVIDFTCRLSKPLESFESLAQHIDRINQDPSIPLNHIIGVTRDPVVSSDFNGDERSCILDTTASTALNPKFVKFVAYYDNEWAYAVRMVSILKILRLKSINLMILLIG